MRLRLLSIIVLIAATVMVAQDATTVDLLSRVEKEKAEVASEARLYSQSLSKKIDELIAQGKQTKDPVKSQLLLQQARWLLPEPKVDLPQHVSRVLGCLKFKHDQFAMAVTYAPDQKSLFTAGRDGTVRHWSLENGRALQTWYFDQPLSAMALSPDGRLLAVAEGYRLSPSLDLSTLPNQEDYVVHVIDLGSKQVKQKFSGSKTAIMSLAFSADSQMLAAGSQYTKAETLRIWNLSSGKLEKQFKPVQSILNITWSRDGNRLFASTGDRSFCVFDFKTGLQASAIRERGMIYGLALSPDEQQLAVAGDIADEAGSFCVKIYQVSDWKVVQTLTGHAAAITCLMWHADGNTLVSASSKPEASIKVWNLKQKAAHTQYQGHTSDVLAVAIDKSGGQLASVSLDGTTRLWQTSEVKPPRTLLKGKSPVWVVSSMGRQFLTAGADQTAILWDAEATQELKRFTEHKAPLTAGAIRPDGNEIATGGGDSAIRLWDTATGKLANTLTGHSGVITALVYSPDGKKLYSASADKTIRFWNLADGKASHKLEQHRSVVTSLAVNLDGSLLASGGADNLVRVWRTSNGSELRSLLGHSGAITGLAFSPGGTLLASVGADGMTRIWEPSSRSDALRTFTGHTGQLMAVAFSPNNKYLATAGADETIRVWNLNTGGEARVLKGHSDWITSLAYLSDGETLVSSSVDGTVQLWPVNRAFEPVAFGHEFAIRYMASSRNGKTLASAGEDGKIILWDAMSGNELVTLNGHQSLIKAMVFSNDGTLLVSADKDMVLKLWDVATGKELQSFLHKCDGFNRLAFLNDDRGIVASIGASTISLWKMENRQVKPEPVLSFLGYERHANSVAFAHDQVALAGTDGAIQLWLMDKFKQSGSETFKAYQVAVHEILFSADGKRLLTCNQDNEFKLWIANEKEKKLLKAWMGKPGRLTAMALNTDGSRALTSLDTGEVFLWDTVAGKELRTWKFRTAINDLVFAANSKHSYAGTSHGIVFQLDLP